MMIVSFFWFLVKEMSFAHEYMLIQLAVAFRMPLSFVMFVMCHENASRKDACLEVGQ